jgi:hypothetical protein
MKRLVGLFVLLAFFVGVAGVYSSDAAAVKKVVAKKKVVVKKVVKKPVVKKAPIKAAPAPIAPPPPPVAPVPPPAPVVVKPAANAGLFGMGLNTSLDGLYISTGKGSLSGSVGVMGNLVLDDFIGLGPMVGLSANAVKFKVGTGYVMGGGGIKAVPVYGGGIISLPAEWMGGLDSYLAGGLNYVAYGNGKTSGKLGGDVYFGIKADLGLGLGKTGFELGYSVVRSNTITSKGFSLAVSQPIVL